MISKNIKVTFFINTNNYLDVSSSLLFDDIDMLQILLTELTNQQKIDKFLRLVSDGHKVTNWLQEVEALPIEKEQKAFVLLTIPIFEDENGIPEVLISLSRLKRILKDWKRFILSKNKEFIAEY